MTQVQSRSEGNPFFVEELMAAMPSTSISDELRRMILLRVDRMSESARQLVGVAAAIGVRPDGAIALCLTPYWAPSRLADWVSATIAALVAA